MSRVEEASRAAAGRWRATRDIRVKFACFMPSSPTIILLCWMGRGVIMDEERSEETAPKGGITQANWYRTLIDLAGPAQLLIAFVTVVLAAGALEFLSATLVVLALAALAAAGVWLYGRRAEAGSALRRMLDRRRARLMAIGMPLVGLLVILAIWAPRSAVPDAVPSKSSASDSNGASATQSPAVDSGRAPPPAAGTDDTNASVPVEPAAGPSKLTEAQYAAMYAGVPAEAQLSNARTNERFVRPTLAEVSVLVGRWCTDSAYGRGLTTIRPHSRGLEYRNGFAGNFQPIAVLVARFFNKQVYYLQGDHIMGGGTFFEFGANKDSAVESMRGMNSGDDSKGFVYYWERCE